MAENDATEEVKPSGGKKKLIIIVVLALLLIGGGGAAAYFFILSPSAESPAEAAAPVRLRAEYVKLRMPGDKPSFVVSLMDSNGRQRFMQVFVEAKVRDPAITEALKLHMPLVVDRLNFLLSSVNFLEVQTHEGRLAMQKQALEAVKEILQAEMGKAEVEAILFTNLVLQ